MTVSKNKTFLDPNFIAYMVEKGEDFSGTLNTLLKVFPELYTDVRCLQEIVYRYHLLGETELGYERAMQVRRQLKVLSVSDEDLKTMETFMELYPKHIPRELLHVSVMKNQDLTDIVCAPTSSYSEIESVNSLQPIRQVSSRF